MDDLIKKIQKEIERDILAEKLQFICQIKTYTALDKQFFEKGIPSLKKFEYLILVPDEDTKTSSKVYFMLAYGKLKSDVDKPVK